jgi:hypothetical protein
MRGVAGTLMRAGVSGVISVLFSYSLVRAGELLVLYLLKFDWSEAISPLLQELGGVAVWSIGLAPFAAIAGVAGCVFR